MKKRSLTLICIAILTLAAVMFAMCSCGKGSDGAMEINKSGKTVIIVTHDEGIAKMTNRIITISDGKIVGDN